MPKLCILTQYWPPEMGAPQGRLSELGERLIDLGWEVEALTALPNYPTGQIFPDYQPFDPITEMIGRIRTVRVPMWPSKHGMAKRLVSYFSFVGSTLLHGQKLCHRPDVLLVESPPLFILLAAWRLARRWRCPYVMNVSDLWPESAVRMGAISKNHPATRLAERLERAGYQKAALVTGQSQEIIDGVIRAVPEVRTCIVTNGVDPNRFGPDHADQEARDLVGSDPGPIFIFAGLMGLAQGLDQILDVAKRMPRDLPGRFVLVGDGPVKEHLEKRIAKEKINRVKLIPPQPRHRIPPLLACADAALITLGMKMPGAVPSKIYEAMAAGLPIVVVAHGEPVKRVLDAQAGLGVQPDDPTALLTTITRLINDEDLRRKLGASGRQAACTTYHRDRIAKVLSDALHNLV